MTPNPSNQESERKQYVAGFVFNETFSSVALIRKGKPDWQKGLLNGIGGKIEPNEQGSEAMVREFKEEAGVSTKPIEWEHFAVLQGPDWSVKFYAMSSNETILAMRSQEDEQIERRSVSSIPLCALDMIENLPWLISLAIDHLTDGRPNFAIISYP